MNPAHSEPKRIQIMAARAAGSLDVSVHFPAPEMLPPNPVSVVTSKEYSCLKMTSPGCFLGTPAIEFRLWKTRLFEVLQPIELVSVHSQSCSNLGTRIIQFVVTEMPIGAGLGKG